ncbi:MAG: hypothetical protein PHR53_08270 [Bacteroidales bacterium]|nr:hypothetical protein [Bacteroidales bacterium]
MDKNGLWNTRKLVFFNDFDAITPDFINISSDDFFPFSYAQHSVSQNNNDNYHQKNTHFQVVPSISNFWNADGCFWKQIIATTKFCLDDSSIFNHSYCNSGASLQYAKSMEHHQFFKGFQTYYILT